LQDAQDLTGGKSTTVEKWSGQYVTDWCDIFT
jgi:hypothetical protein